MPLRVREADVGLSETRASERIAVGAGCLGPAECRMCTTSGGNAGGALNQNHVRDGRTGGRSSVRYYLNEDAWKAD